MSATMARQGGHVQLEQSNMRLALNMPKMANWGFLYAAIEDMKYLIKKPRTEVREEKKQGVEFPGHETVKAEIERHPVVLRHNPKDGCLICPHVSAMNPQTHLRCKRSGTPPPEWCRQMTTEPMPPLPAMPPLPGMPLVLPRTNARAECSKIDIGLAGYTYSHTSLSGAELFTLDSSAQDSQYDTDFDQDMLTDE